MQFQVQKELGLARPPAVVSVKTGEGRKELLESIDELVDSVAIQITEKLTWDARKKPTKTRL